MGGEEIYRLAMPVTDRIYLTRIHTELEGDTFYPEPDWKNWRLVSKIKNQKDKNNPFDYDYLIYERR